MHVDVAACQDAGAGRSFPMCALSREAKSVTSDYSSREGAKYSPGNRSGDPYTSSADEAFKSSFQVPRIPNRTNGRASAQCSSAWHIRVAFRYRWSLSIRPSEAVCHTVVRVREDPVRFASLEETVLELPDLVLCDLLGAAETSNPD